jgi:hypothetical protein
MISKFDSEKLNVNYIPPMNRFGPIEGRKYTMTHSDETGELFLTIGNKFDFSMIDPRLRDEVIAEWRTKDGEYRLMGKVYVSGGEFDAKFSKIRYMIFKKEVELALTGIVYGDQNIYLQFPWLLDSPIFIKFDSVFPEYEKIIYYGTPRQYLFAAANKVKTKTQA